MADAYKAWLQEQVDYYTDQCLKSADQRGYPGKIRFAEQSYRDILDTFEECLSKYNELAPSPTLPDQESEQS